MLVFLLACPTVIVREDAPAAVRAVVTGEPAAQSGAREPAGIIGGEPILPRAVVVGGLSEAAVTSAIAGHRVAIDRCYESERALLPALAGKVLVRFSVLKDGAVADATIRSTSLRHPPTEACVAARVSEVRFPPLASGEKAIVTWPFVFPS